MKILHISLIFISLIFPLKKSSAAEITGKSWTEKNTGMEFVWVEGGCFQMGNVFGGGYEREKPVHEVCLDGFYIGKYEVTQAQWTKIMANNPSFFKKGGAYPVEQVSWNDAQAYIKKLSSRNEKTFRLPTEAEWEYACRSGGKKEKFCGNSNIFDLGWYEYNSAGESHPVGTKEPNGLGIYDMSGNVYEWTNDWYASYGKSRQQNPQGASFGIFRALRGGSWYSFQSFTRSFDRGRGRPGRRGFNLGFRLVFEGGKRGLPK